MQCKFPDTKGWPFIDQFIDIRMRVNGVRYSGTIMNWGGDITNIQGMIVGMASRVKMEIMSGGLFKLEPNTLYRFKFDGRKRMWLERM